MSAGRDVERLIEAWLVEESPARAPDRILETAGSRIDRTKQRRFAAAWRNTMTISFARVAMVAAIIAIAVVGAGILGRATAGVGAGPTPLPSTTATPSAVPAPSVATLSAYRAARDAICTSYVAQAGPINDRISGIGDGSLSSAQRAPKIDALEELAGLADRMRSDLQALPVPQALVTEHSANLARYEDSATLLHEIVARYRAGDVQGAAVIDQAIAPISGAIQEFERTYDLVDCL
jgi:hypothetical protein